jgi:hypothetical protein
LVGCGSPSLDAEGLFGDPIRLMSGDASPLPRLAFVDEGCPGAAARGGCELDGDRACGTLLIDTLAPMSALAREGLTGPEFHRECLEIRSAEGLAAAAPDADALAAAVARFRFHDLPLVRAPAGGRDGWSWFAGTAAAPVEPRGVLGGNLLRDFAIAMRHPNDGPATMTFYAEFPGSDDDLADQGRAFLALQFPGRLLGRDVGDRCDYDPEGCRVDGFDLARAQPNFALKATRMVLDACVAPPPCALRYQVDAFNPFESAVCESTPGPELDGGCAAASDPVLGGRPASLVVATSVPSMVLFEDSAIRMFGPLDQLTACSAATQADHACLWGNDGVIAFTGWPAAGVDDPLPRIAVRAVALVAGSTRTRDANPCRRVADRQAALVAQCTRYTQAITSTGDVRDTAPPYSADPDTDARAIERDRANASMAILGEPFLQGTTATPDPDAWIEAIVVPASHPLPVALRLDVAPEAIQPDGLIGARMLEDTSVVLDYTDPNPSVRLECLDPRAGDCLVAPDCKRDRQPACCYGLPLPLLVDFILQAQDETCCTALSAAELEEIQLQGVCLGVEPP